MSSRILHRHYAVVNMLIACPFRYEQTFPDNCTPVHLLLTQSDFMVPDPESFNAVDIKAPITDRSRIKCRLPALNHLTIYKYFHCAGTVHGTTSISINRTSFEGTRCILHMLASYPTYFDTPHAIFSGSLCGCYHIAFETARFAFKHFMHVNWNLRMCVILCTCCITDHSIALW